LTGLHRKPLSVIDLETFSLHAKTMIDSKSCPGG
jgi:hypothetical protein